MQLKALVLSILFILVGTQLAVAQIDTINPFNIDTNANARLIKIVKANKLVGRNNDSIKYALFIGDVQFEHQDAVLFCDTAYHFFEENRLEAFGDVVVVQDDSIHIFSDTLFYDGASRIADLFGNVQMTDQQMQLDTEELHYDLNTKIGHYPVPGILSNADNVLTSNAGYYYVESKDALFIGDVVLQAPQYNLASDSLKYNIETERADFLSATTIQNQYSSIECGNGWYDTKNDLAYFAGRAQLNNPPQILIANVLEYNQNTGIGEAFGNVYWEDTSENIIIESNYGKYNDAEQSVYTTENPVLSQISDGDTLYIGADVLESFKPDTTLDDRIFKCYKNVRIYRNDFQAVSDSLYYSTTDSIFQFYYDPILWTDSSQLKADTIYLHTADATIDKIDMRSNATIGSVVYTDIYNQIKGKNIDGFFEAGKLKTVFVKGNAESIFFAQDDDDALSGVNQAICSRMRINLDSNKVQNIRFLTEPEATFSPIAEVNPEGMRLKDFNWYEDLRPLSKEDIVNPENKKINQQTATTTRAVLSKKKGFIKKEEEKPAVTKTATLGKKKGATPKPETKQVTVPSQKNNTTGSQVIIKQKDGSIIKQD